MHKTDCAIIILAAGNSSRLGTPKQLLVFNNKTLLQHSVDEALASKEGEVMVVTGANHSNIISSLSNQNLHFVYNEHWQQGMAGSIAAGLSALLSISPALSSVIIMVCDQPYVSSALVHEMMAKKQATNKGIVACVYNETLGVPALFSDKYFDALLSLKGTEGAKKIINRNAGDVTVLPFTLGAIDIDTKEDYDQLVK